MNRIENCRTDQYEIRERLDGVGALNGGERIEPEVTTVAGEADPEI